jgi:LacI family transcriptional regulator
MPTIRDVAKKAGVATTTVSRVLNNNGYVSADTRARVEAAIEELGYVPNRVARSLRLKRTNTLALVVTDITNPFWTTVVRGVEDAAHEAGFTVILCNTDESPSKQDAYLQVLLQKRVDGILLAPTHSTAEPVALIQRQKMPVVVLDRRVPGAAVDLVRCDSQGGAYKLVQHLIELGHRRIAVLSGPENVSTATDRVIGYRRAMREAGLAVADAWVRHGQFTVESGAEGTRELLAQDPHPTAILAANNFIATGVLRVFRATGFDVPGDVSVVAFDDLVCDPSTTPFLTVANQPAYEMGQQATELLVARLSDPAADGYRDIVLPTEIVVRRSTGPVKPAMERVLEQPAQAG